MSLPRQPAVSRSIVLLTDGYIDAEADVFDYVRNQLDDANFFAFGIGSSVNRFLIEGVARAGLGEPFIVTHAWEAPEAAAKLRRYIDSPVLTGIDVTFPGFDAYDVEPRKVPDLFASRPLVVFGKWRGARRWIDRDLRGDGSRTLPRLDSPSCRESSDARQSALRHLWARTRIANLSDFGPRHAERRTRGRDHVAGTDLRAAHALHVVHRRAGDRAAHHRRCGRRRSAAAASGGRVGSCGRRDQRRRSPSSCGWSAIVVALFASVRLLRTRRLRPRSRA